MSINRDNIFNYFIYIQDELDVWDSKMTPDTRVLVQKTFEHFVNELPKNNDYVLTEDDINKLHFGFISIVAKSKEDQFSLNSRFDNWHKQYLQQIEEESPLIPLDIKETLLEKSVSKESLLLKLLFLTPIFILFYFIYVSLDPFIEQVKHDGFDIEITEMDSISQFSIDITTLIDYDSIRYSIDEDWKGKTSIEKHEVELNNGILYSDDRNFGSYEFLASKTGESETSFFLKTKESIWGVVKEQEVGMNLKVAEIIDPDVSDNLDDPDDPDVTVAKLDTFPSMNYQSYPYPSRTLKWLEDNAKLEKSFLGKYLLPISLLISIISWLLLYFFNKRKVDQKSEQKAKYGHPYFWKIKTHNKQGVKLSEHVDKQVHLLRTKLPSGRNKLNLPRTIRKSVKSAGFVSFQYAEESLKTEYLFLIGYRTQSDHIAKLWTEVANGLNAKDINTSIYHYNSDIRLCYNDQFQNGLSLKELYNHYPNSILVVIGEHYNFLNPKTGKFNSWHHVFENWSTRYLLTSKNYYNWDRREDILGTIFKVLPSKISSLPFLQLHTEHSNESNYEPDWDEHLNDYSQEFSIDDIRISFTKEQRDWIAACCLFPTLHYDLSLAIGHIVFAHHNKNLSSSEIEEVFSLSWFYEGSIPEHIRSSLINDLVASDQTLVNKVRSFISDDSNFYSPPRGSHASDLYREGILINKLLNTSSHQDAGKRYKIEKELNEIYSRGLEADIQIKPKIEGIKNPSKILQLRRWMSKSRNIKNSLIAFASLIVPYIILSAIPLDDICPSSFPPIDKILLNDELSISTFTNDEAYEVTENVVICKTNLGEREENNIWDENIVRTKIFLDQYEEMQLFTDTSDLEDKYDSKFLNNLTVDLFNKAMQYTNGLKGLTANDIRQDTLKENEAIQFCKLVDFSQRFFELQDDSLKHDFEDTLAMSLKWCEDNDMKEKLSSVGIYGLDPTAENYNFVKRILEQRINARVEPVNDPGLTNSESKLLFADQANTNTTIDLASELGQVLNINIAPGFRTAIKRMNHDYLLYIAESSSEGGCNCNEGLGTDDTEPPVFITNVEDIIVTSNREDCQMIVPWDDPKVRDNCSLEALVSTYQSGYLFPRGETKITYTATDKCGNKSTSSFTVTVTCNQGNTKINVSGKVIDATTNDAISGALVIISGYPEPTLTDDLGEFSLSLDPATRNPNSPSVNSNLLNISKDGYIENTIRVSDQSSDLRIELEPIDSGPANELYGSVVDDSGDPINLATVSIMDFENTSIDSVLTDDDGNFTLALIKRPIVGFITISKPGYDAAILDWEKAKSPIRITLKKVEIGSGWSIWEPLHSNGDVQVEISFRVPKINSCEPNGERVKYRYRIKGVQKKNQSIVSYILNWYLDYIDCNGDMIRKLNALEIGKDFSDGSDNWKLIESLDYNFSGLGIEGFGISSEELPNETNTATDDVYGTVIDGTGKPLSGVKIFIEGTRTGTTSDSDGKFRLEKPNRDGMLEFTYQGYESKSIDMETAEMPLNVRLKLNDDIRDRLESLNTYILKGYVYAGKSPVIGAKILGKGNIAGTITDSYGEFSLYIPSGKATIIISYTGFRDLEVIIDSSYWDKEGRQIKELNIDLSNLKSKN